MAMDIWSNLAFQQGLVKDKSPYFSMNPRWSLETKRLKYIKQFMIPQGVLLSIKQRIIQRNILIEMR